MATNRWDESEREFAFSGGLGAQSWPLAGHTRRLEVAKERTRVFEGWQAGVVSEGTRRQMDTISNPGDKQWH